MAFFWFALVCLGAVAANLLHARRHLLALDARCEAAAAAVEAELNALHVMFPALVGLMRAFSPQEREAIDLVARAHAAAQRAASPQAKLLAETRLNDGVHQLLGRAQSVSQIRNLSDFRELQVALDEAERRLADARRMLSVATNDYNCALDRFPESLFAMRLQLTRRAFYDIGVEQALADEVAA